MSWMRVGAGLAVARVVVSNFAWWSRLVAGAAAVVAVVVIIAGKFSPLSDVFSLDGDGDGDGEGDDGESVGLTPSPRKFPLPSI